MTSHSSGAADTFNRRAIPSGANESRWLAADGHPVRRIDWPVEGGRTRGSILFMPGRADLYEKYLEVLDGWNHQGWHVTGGDWRGQSGSGRLGMDALTGHIDDFSVWVDDLAAFWARWKQETPAPHVLVGHSMGGHLVLRALAEGRVDPDAVVLSAPMLGVPVPFLPQAAIAPIARLVARLGDPRRTAWKTNEKPGTPPQDRIDLLTHDRNRYEDELWWRRERPELVMGPPSWGWMAAALASCARLRALGFLEGVQAPVLIVAPRKDRLVDFVSSERAARRLPHGEFLPLGPEARHEILREADPVRQRVLTAIDEFLRRVVPLPQGSGNDSPVPGIRPETGS